VPASRITTGSFRRSSRAISSIAGAATRAGGGAARGVPGTPPGFQQTSEGRIKVAIAPGGVLAAKIASAASAPTSAAVRVVQTQPETPCAHPSVSAVSGASSGR
jgi:hypothetical protein